MEQLTKLHPDTFEVIGSAKNGMEALEMINKLKPDLIFLDIQMPGIDGFEVLRKATHSPFVIFCTAYNQYALQAFESASVDYLLKPVSEDRFAHTVEKLHKFNGLANSQNIYQLLQHLSSNQIKEDPTSIPVKIGDKVIFVRLDDVSFFKADEKYATVITKQAKSHIIDTSLKKLEEKLPDAFLRVHRSYIINKTHLKEVRKYFNNRYILILDDYEQSRITSGKSYYAEIKQMFEL